MQTIALDAGEAVVGSCVKDKLASQ